MEQAGMPSNFYIKAVLKKKDIKNKMKKILKAHWVFLYLILVLFLGSLYASAQLSNSSNTVIPVQAFTATNQTQVVHLGQNPGGSGGSYSVANISVSGTALTTVSFQVLGSSDGGVTFPTALNVSLITSPSTVTTTTTVTTPGIYQVNLPAITDIKIVTSGTFTATSVVFTVTLSPNGTISRSTSGSGGPPTGSAGNGLTGNYPNPGLASAAVVAGVAGQSIAPSAVSSKVVNLTGYSVLYASADMATRINLCIADVIAGTITTCDASLETSVNLSTQITAGNSSAAHGKLIVPCTGSWQANFTNTSGYALQQYGGFDIQGACPLSNNFYIGTTPTSNVYAIYGATGNSFSYIHASGFSVINSGGNATVSGYSSVIDGTNATDAFADGSFFQNVGISDGTNGGVKGGVGAILFRNVCCGLTYYNAFLSGSGVGTPVTIQASSSSIVQTLNFVGVTFVGPGSGLPVFSCQDTSTTPTSVVSVFGGYSESDTSNTSSNEAYIDGCRKVTFYGHSFSSNIASNASSLFTTTNRFNTDLEIYGASAIPGVGTWAYPTKAIVNGFTGETLYTDSLGNYGKYSPPTVPSSFGPTQIASLGLTTPLSAANGGSGATSLGVGLEVAGSTLVSNAESMMSFQPGTLTSVVSTTSLYGKFVKASTVDNLIGSALLYSCTTAPTITLWECGTSTTCVSPVSMGTVTLTTNGQAFAGTLTSPTIAAGHYVAWSISGGICTSVNLAATAQWHSN